MNSSKKPSFIQRTKATMRLFNRAYGPYRWYMVGLAGLGFLAAVFEAVGINAVIPLFSFFSDGGSPAPDVINRYIMAGFEFFGIPFTLPAVMMLIVTLFILKAVVTILMNYVKARIRFSYEQHKKDALFRQMLRADWKYLSEQSLGHLDTLIKVEIPKSSEVLGVISAVGVTAVTSLAYLGVAVNISETITILSVLVGAVFFYVMTPIFFYVRRYARRVAHTNKEVARHINNNVLGMKTVKAMGVEKPVEEQGHRFFLQLRDWNIRSRVLQSISNALIQPVSVVFVVLVVAYSFYFTSYNLAALAVILYLINRMFGLVQQLQKKVNSINDGIPYIASMLDYEERVAEFREVPRGESGKSFAFEREIVIKDVDFSYKAGEVAVHQLNAVIKKGEMVGLVGPSGAGKTTVFDLLLRLYTPNRGAIEVDGMNVCDINLADWRRHISYVPQETFLFEGTVSDNIRFYDESISDEAVRDAAQQAHVIEFVEELPQGLDTPVGERGVQFSAGQRQRISIARALARQPKILLMDEATSALDSASEQAIQKTLLSLKGKVTILIIAHRLATVLDADRLFVIEKGSVIEEGQPKELLKNSSSHFARMYRF